MCVYIYIYIYIKIFTLPKNYINYNSLRLLFPLINICMYMCVYMCMRVCVYVCMRVCVCAFVYKLFLFGKQL